MNFVFIFILLGSYTSKCSDGEHRRVETFSLYD